ncbi:MAG: PIN domain-containing protein [Alphaproteobacteria bacterium]|nr:PIN domain-containing protein [Alphaproteobacteria bacterium]
MILVDTSIWIDHFRAADPQLTALLTRNEVISHPCVIGEIALGSVKARANVLRHLKNLPGAVVATHSEVMVFIEAHALANAGIGYVDACLLAATALTRDALFWSRDKNLRACAQKCGLTPSFT